MEKLEWISSKERKQSVSLIEEVQKGFQDQLKESVSRSFARRLIIRGKVFSSGRVLKKPDLNVNPQSALTVYYQESELKKVRQISDPDLDFSICHQDEDLLIVNKPAGIPSHATVDPRRKNLLGLVSERFSQEEGGDPYLVLHHRLDKDTSGLVLFSRSKRANPGVAELFSKRKVIKTYQAVVLNRAQKKPGDRWVTRNYLKRKKSTSLKVARMEPVRSGGDVAETAFRVLAVKGALAWVEALPKTGRTHQIRTHLESENLPILGDPIYGGVSAPRLFLHAYRLSFEHPILHKQVEVEAPLPPEFENVKRETTG